MVNIHKRSLLFISLIFFGTLVVSACTPTPSDLNAGQIVTDPPDIEETEVTSVSLEDTLEANGTDTEHSMPSEKSPININGLSDAEINSLVFMREEEKLARDVYLALYDQWGLQIFQNIANSEQTHTDAVAKLLEKFDIPDPADTSPEGEFVNPDLQTLFDELIELGSQSLGDALKVGAAVEEIDIIDLQEALEITQDQSIRKVYENLLNGSENHLRAFTSTLEKQTGEIYQPDYLGQEVYDGIISGSSRRGGQSKGNQP